MAAGSATVLARAWLTMQVSQAACMADMIRSTRHHGPGNMAQQSNVQTYCGHGTRIPPVVTARHKARHLLAAAQEGQHSIHPNRRHKVLGHSDALVQVDYRVPPTGQAKRRVDACKTAACPVEELASAPPLQCALSSMAAFSPAARHEEQLARVDDALVGPHAPRGPAVRDCTRAQAALPPARPARTAVRSGQILAIAVAAVAAAPRRVVVV